MSTFLYDLNPVDFIIADAIGEPGKRTFFLQGRTGRQVVSLALEKQEVSNLAASVLQLLEELENKYPDLAPATRTKKVLYPESPYDPAFRVSQLILGYDEERDQIWLIAKALVLNESGAIVDPDDEEANVPAARFVATRAQMRALSEHAMEVVARSSGLPAVWPPHRPRRTFLPADRRPGRPYRDMTRR